MLQRLIQDSLLTFDIKSLREDEMVQINNVISRYVARIATAKEVKQTLKKIGSKDIKWAIEHLKKDHLDHTGYFLSQLWRAVYEVVRYGLKRDYIAKRYGVFERDIEFVLSNLKPNEIERIKKSRRNTEQFKKRHRVKYFNEIQKYAKKMAGKKLQFLYKNDQAFEKYDFVNDLAEEGWRSFLFYEHLLDPLKVLNYARRSVHNRCMNLIQYWKAGSRVILEEVEKHDKDAPMKTEAEKDEGLNSQKRVFNKPKISIEETFVVQGEDGEMLSLVDFTSDQTIKTPEAEIHDGKLMEALQTATFSGRTRKFIDMVIGGELDDDFKQWLWRTHQARLKDVHGHYEMLGEYVREYLHVSVRRLSKEIGLYIDPGVLKRAKKRYKAAQEAQ